MTLAATPWPIRSVFFADGITSTHRGRSLVRDYATAQTDRSILVGGRCEGRDVEPGYPPNVTAVDELPPVERIDLVVTHSPPLAADLRCRGFCAVALCVAPAPDGGSADSCSIHDLIDDIINVGAPALAALAPAS